MQTRCNKIADWAAALLLLCTGGGVGGYGVWHHASGIIAGQEAQLQHANHVIAAQNAAVVAATRKIEQGKTALAAATDAEVAAKTSLAAAEKREQALQVQLARAEAALTANEPLRAGLKELSRQVEAALKVKSVSPPPAPQAKPATPAPPKVKPATATDPATVAFSTDLAGGVDSVAMVAAHNRWRSEVGLAGLKWSGKLAGAAQGWADRLAGNNCAMHHSGNGYGENIYQASALMWPDGRREFRSVSPRRPVDAWGEEKQWYDAETGQCSATGRNTCDHYTQVVWKGTKEVGCAMAVCDNNAQVWVCNYFPAGNIVGRKPF